MIKKWLPLFFYLIVFFILSPRLFGCFSSHFYTDTGDGLQNVWNIWWINYAVSHAGKSPWFTDFLHFPEGTSLLGHTLNPFNGLVGIVLQKFLSLVQTYNTIVVFSFVMGGMTAYWLCRELTGSVAGSLIGGAVFTFSNYHFMHAEGHLQLVSLEWLPLFILLWVRFCGAPDFRKGLLASLALFLVVLCDYYYFFYSVITGILFFLWVAWKKQDVFFLLRKKTLPGFWGFFIPALLTSGVLMGFFIYHNLHDPFIGSHPARSLSADLFSPLIWGPHWLFRNWVEPLWRPLCQMKGADEYSVYLGLSVIALSVYTWKKRSALYIKNLTFWVLLAGFFFVMSLGPNLHIGGREIGLGWKFHCMGKEINPLLLPYAFIWLVFPPLRLSGVPIRMMIMVQLVAAIMVAGGILALMKLRSPWKYGIAAAFLVVCTFEYLPAPIPLTKPSCPDYVESLKNLPDGAVLDLVSPSAWALYYQTVHKKKMAFGYISRTPASVQHRDDILTNLILEGKWDQIARDFRVIYVIKGSRIPDTTIPVTSTLPAGTLLPEIAAEKKIFTNHGISIYRL
jgi:hypothetical protein